MPIRVQWLVIAIIMLPACQQLGMGGLPGSGAGPQAARGEWPAVPRLAEVIGYARYSQALDGGALQREIADARAEVENGGPSSHKLRLAILLTVPGPEYSPAESARLSREFLESGQAAHGNDAFAEVWAGMATRQADLIARQGETMRELESERAVAEKLRSQLEALKRIEMQSTGATGSGGQVRQ